MCGCDRLSGALWQVFAGAVVVIYNVAGIGQLVLTRQLTYDIFVGAVTSWWAPAGLPACCASAFAFRPLLLCVSFAFRPWLLCVSLFAPLRFALCSFAFRALLLRVSVSVQCPGQHLRGANPLSVEIDSPRFCRKDSNFAFEPVNFVYGPSLPSPGLYQVRPRHSARPVVGDRGGKRRDFLQPAQRRRHPYCPWVRCRAQYCAIDGAAPYTR